VDPPEYVSGKGHEISSASSDSFWGYDVMCESSVERGPAALSSACRDVNASVVTDRWVHADFPALLKYNEHDTMDETCTGGSVPKQYDPPSGDSNTNTVNTHTTRHIGPTRRATCSLHEPRAPTSRSCVSRAEHVTYFACSSRQTTVTYPAP
jgi:hypothetical protein